METQIGLLDSIWVNIIDPLVIFFVVVSNYGDINCIFSNSEKADKILFLQNRVYTVEVTGETSPRNQFIVTKFKIINPDHITQKLGI